MHISLVKACVGLSQSQSKHSICFNGSKNITWKIKRSKRELWNTWTSYKVWSLSLSPQVMFLHDQMRGCTEGSHLPQNIRQRAFQLSALGEAFCFSQQVTASTLVRQPHSGKQQHCCFHTLIQCSIVLPAFLASAPQKVWKNKGIHLKQCVFMLHLKARNDKQYPVSPFIPFPGRPGCIFIRGLRKDFQHTQKLSKKKWE